MAPIDQSESRLLSLPLDIRLQIYSCFDEDTVIYIGSDIRVRDGVQVENGPEHLNLLLVCFQIRREATPMVWKNTVVQLGFWFDNRITDFYARKMSHLYRHIRQLQIRLHSWKMFGAHDVHKYLHDCADGNGIRWLEQLDLVLDETSPMMDMFEAAGLEN